MIQCGRPHLPVGWLDRSERCVRAGMCCLFSCVQASVSCCLPVLLVLCAVLQCSVAWWLLCRALAAVCGGGCPPQLCPTFLPQTPTLRIHRNPTTPCLRTSIPSLGHTYILTYILHATIHYDVPILSQLPYTVMGLGRSLSLQSFPFRFSDLNFAVDAVMC